MNSDDADLDQIHPHYYSSGERAWWEEKPIYVRRAQKRIDALLNVGASPKIKTDVYSFLEAWWGAIFDENLIEHIISSPIESLLEMEQAWPRATVDDSLAELAAGSLRPIVPSLFKGGSLTNASLLLAYSDEVVADQKFYNLFQFMDENLWNSHFTGRYDFDEW
ncbi:MAG TPA: hypothetical protein VII84_00250, partial [Acidimicrobiales bacterium]